MRQREKDRALAILRGLFEVGMSHPGRKFRIEQDTVLLIPARKGTGNCSCALCSSVKYRGSFYDLTDVFCFTELKYRLGYTGFENTTWLRLYKALCALEDAIYENLRFSNRVMKALDKVIVAFEEAK